MKDTDERKSKRIVACIIVSMMLIATIVSCAVPPDTWKYLFYQPDIEKRKAGELRIHFLDVGQGDSTLIELPDGKVMLIDGGNGSNSVTNGLMRYLMALDIKAIDYLVVTHTDRDHYGGIVEVFDKLKVRNAYMPMKYSIQDIGYAKIYEKAVKEKCPLQEPTRNIVLSRDGATPYTLCFLYPYGVDGVESWGNESSAVVWLDYHGVSAAFSGDATVDVEKKMIRDDRLGALKARGVELSSTEIVKIGHHGGSESNGAEWLTYLNPQCGIISVGKDNSYSHPTEGTLKRLEQVGAKTYRTDELGHIVVTATEAGEYTVSSVKKRG